MTTTKKSTQPVTTWPTKGPASYFPSIEKTYGRSIAEWQQLLRASRLTKHSELVNWLKSNFDMGHGHATALVGYTLAEDAKNR